jgi:tetratricopeptide (TPR) repeat protein
MNGSLKDAVPFHIILIAIVGLIVYSNTFNVPFQWDDSIYIEDNPVIKDFSYFLEPSKAKALGETEYSGLRHRYVAFLTFALNYRLHGLDVTGFHVFNIALHITNAFLVYLLLVLTFKTPFLGRSSLGQYARYIALFTSLLFVSHPVQTEAVTYVVQRFVPMVTFFYLGSLLLYVKWRLSSVEGRMGGKRAFFLYLASIVSVVLAMKTKENAFTLPFTIALYEFMFFAGSSFRKRVLWLVPFFLTLLIIPLSYMGIDRPAGEIISGLDSATRYHTETSRMDYLLTQFRVMVTYIRLLFLPVNQTLNYDYPLFQSLFNPGVFLSFLFLSSIFGLGIYLLWRSRGREAGLRLAAFGLFWFFITLSVESSILPIILVICEYRLYLPSVGIFLAIVTGTFLLIREFRGKNVKAVALISLILIILALSLTAYARNSVWESRISLWEDVVSKSPKNAKSFINLAVAYDSRGLTDKAIEHYKISLRLKPDNAKAHNNLGGVYWSEDLSDKAIEHYTIALKLKPDYADVHNNLGLVYRSEGLSDKAIEHYTIALKLKPDYVDAHNNLGVVYGSEGLFDKAIEHFQTVLKLNPDYIETHNNLGNVYRLKGLFDIAIEHYKTVLKFKPDNTDAHYNLGLAYLDKGLTDEAREQFETALRIDPNYHKARRILNRINNPLPN